MPADIGIQLHLPEGGRPVHARHHHVHQDRVRLALRIGGRVMPSAPRTGRHDLPACSGLERKGGYLADVVFIVNDQDMAH